MSPTGLLSYYLGLKNHKSFFGNFLWTNVISKVVFRIFWNKKRRLKSRALLFRPRRRPGENDAFCKHAVRELYQLLRKMKCGSESGSLLVTNTQGRGAHSLGIKQK